MSGVLTPNQTIGSIKAGRVRPRPPLHWVLGRSSTSSVSAAPWTRPPRLICRVFFLQEASSSDPDPAAAAAAAYLHVRTRQSHSQNLETEETPGLSESSARCPSLTWCCRPEDLHTGQGIDFRKLQVWSGTCSISSERARMLYTGLQIEINSEMQSQQASGPFSRLHNIQQYFTEIKIQVQHMLPHHIDLPVFLWQTQFPQLYHENSSAMHIQSLQSPLDCDQQKQVLSCGSVSKIPFVFFFLVSMTFSELHVLAIRIVLAELKNHFDTNV